MQLISHHHNNWLAEHLDIKQARKLVARNFYWPMLCSDVETCVKELKVCLALKTPKYKVSHDCQSLLVPTHSWKNLLMNFVTNFPLLTDQKRDNYDTIFVIINLLTKMVYYQLIKITRNATILVEVIIDVVIRHPDFSEKIVSKQNLFLISEFQSLLYCFFRNKSTVFTTFHLQIDNRTQKQNSIFIANLHVLVDGKSKNWSKLLYITEFLSNNARNASTDYTTLISTLAIIIIYFLGIEIDTGLRSSFANR